MPYLAVSALVLVKVPDNGSYRVDYHYAGSVISHLDDEQRERLVREGHVREIAAPAVAASSEPTGDETPAPVVDRPAQTAPLDAWQAYAISKGHTQAELDGLTKQDIVTLLS
ncbi:hypothetical protein [Mycolicibacterium brisbanense]|uniref:Uncharacterized protein n=1 Tax=Mycolicibacterium brisbanense TaxID=146020 RepID=A0A100W6R9_9MYCO|nr:hypothetical protein [Mycolicibacterium brisbanense]MCV7158034.1 hypothetical protein [Mycolicibacterium brisbanense]GAS92684.1 uncharacterized protein RMCB_6780 [Mycolicibacterium brisbanense]